MPISTSDQAKARASSHEVCRQSKNDLSPIADMGDWLTVDGVALARISHGMDGMASCTAQRKKAA
jgi:hypothetical protein